MFLSLLINGCGSSSRTSSTAPSSSRSAPAVGGPAATGSESAPATIPPSAAGPPTSTAGATNVRVPATFVITPSGSLRPATVSAPAGVTVQLSMSSGDGRAHQVELRTAPTRSLAVPAHGQASLLLAGLKAGRYEIEVDGSPAGALIAGAQPGP